MIRVSMVVVLVGLGVYAMIAAFMFFNQRQLLYHPDIKQADPATLGITGAEVTSIKTPDGEKLVTWYAPALAGGRPCCFSMAMPVRSPNGRCAFSTTARPASASLPVLARLWRIDRPAERARAHGRCQRRL